MMLKKSMKQAKAERLALPVIPKQTGRMKVAKGPARDRAHLAAVRREACAVCGSYGDMIRGPIVAHHPRELFPRTMGKRISDHLAISLCELHHVGPAVGVHSMNGMEFWRRHRTNPKQWIAEFSEAGRRALQEAGR